MDEYPVPDDLADRGRSLWIEFGGSREGDPGSRLLLHECCRLADDLERLHRLTRGDADEWVTVKLPRAGGDDDELVLTVHNALTHRRLIVTTLRQTLQDLRRIRSKPVGEEGRGEDVEPDRQGVDVVDEVERRRAARRADAADHARAARADERGS